ncbi:MAG: S9 family peptidase [Sphingomicrobium sp.]
MLSVSLASFSVPAATQTAALEKDAKSFGARNAVRSINISPDGSRIAMVTAGPGRSSVLEIVDLKTLTPHPILNAKGTPESFRWCDFAGNEQLICRYGGNLRINDLLAGFSRLINLDTSGKGMKQLGQSDSFYDASPRQYDGSILDWLPDDRGAVLMSRAYVREEGKIGTRLVRDKEGLGVDRIELPSLTTSSVEDARRGVESYMSDGRGRVRLMETVSINDATGQQSSVHQFHYRTTASRDWKLLGRFDSITDEGISPLAVDASTDSIYALRKLNGRKALYRIALDGSLRETLIGSNDKVDIDDIVRFGHGQRVIGYTFAKESRSVVYFDPEFGKLHDMLTRAVPDRPQIDFLGSSNDGDKLLILASGDTQPGSNYIFERKTRHLNELALSRPDLEHHTLASIASISYPALDGTKVPAYLTLPPGKPAKGLPAIVLPHGGPSSRDEWGFDWLAQFLAARGYAVIQPNYRGSAGFGDAWLAQNGFKSWRTSIGDISSAARYLVADGIADPARLAIVGWSYGGYASLQSVATEPGLYKAAVAIAPVTDLGLLKTEAENYTNADEVAKFVGAGPHIVEGSPLRQAARIRVPVLIFHGSLDTNVDIEHSAKMAAALRDAPTPAEFVRFDGLDHQLEDSDARSQMLLRIGQFLDKAIGH